ncbi:hypothetical protein CIK05_06545 [Bdellovibrio sp. qaytius]|nr:hypothetical protein CIK05_06545 [Bdellovibrio sp. qaytius]
MSNKKSNKKSSAAKSGLAAPKAPLGAPLNATDLNGLAKVKWSSLQTDLKSALGSWSENEQKEDLKSPEEEQLDKVRSLIEDLKERLNEF